MGRKARLSTAPQLRKQIKYYSFIISYNSLNILRFDFLTTVLVLYDCFKVPMRISYGVDFLGPEIKLKIDIFE